MPELNPTIFRLKLADWKRRSADLTPQFDALRQDERKAAQWLLAAWRDYAHSPALATYAKEQIDCMTSGDMAHANNLPLRTASMAFRGIAGTMYCTDAQVYGQFQRALCADAGIPVPSRQFADVPADMPKAASISLCLYDNYRIAQRDVAILEPSDGELRLIMVLNNLTADKKYAFVFELVDGRGTVVRTSAEEYTATGTSGTCQLTAMPVAQIPAGAHTLRVKIGSAVFASFPITKKAGAAPPPPPKKEYTLDSLTIASANAEENRICGNNTVHTTTQRIAPQLTISTADAGARTITFFVSIITPSGTVIRDSNSPASATFSNRRTVSGKTEYTLSLLKWGADHGRLFAIPGTWTVRVSADDGSEISRQFTVRRPRDGRQRFKIAKLSFVDSAKNVTSYLPAASDVITPQLVIRDSNLYSPVQEVSYTIYDSDGRRVAQCAPSNIRIDSGRLPSVRLSSRLRMGTYKIVVAVNGLNYEPIEFRVGKPSTSCMTIFLWIMAINILTGILAAII